MIVIGIDPGKSGGIAWRNELYMRSEKMPATERDVVNILRPISQTKRCIALSSRSVRCQARG